MMNWQKIKDECPKAYWEAHKWSTIECKDIEVVFQDRELYDFFDENGIYGSMRFGGWQEDGSLLWDYEIDFTDSDGEHLQRVAPKDYHSRAEAENEMFADEFSILESQLSQLTQEQH